MGSKFKLFYVLVRNKMPTILPPLAPFQEISWLTAWLTYLWGCYQALMGNYQELQALNIRLQQIAGDAAQRAAAAEKRAAAAEKRAADAEQRAADAEQRAADAEQRAEDAEQCAADAEQRAADAEQRAEDAEQCAADAEEDAAYWQDRAEQAKQELDAMMQQEKAEAAILHELSYDSDWSSVPKLNFVAKQTNAVLKAKEETAQKQAELDKLNSLISKLVDCLPFDGVTQEPVRYPVIIVPSDLTMDAKIVNIGSAMNLKSMMGGKFPTGHGATIESTHECADVKRMYEAIFKLLKLCGHQLDE